ncbi:MAG: IS1634 family transposase [Candidatus Nanoarchaeia archaeon]
MFVRVKTSPKSPRKSVQIVESKRLDGKVKQRIVKHIGVAFDDDELEELKSLANSIKIKLELNEQLPLYTQKEIEQLEKYNKISTDNKEGLKKDINNQKNNINREDYDVNLLDMIEEDRVIKGVHDIYGKLYDELGFNNILYNPARNVASNKALKEIVMARVANPDSKRGSVLNLEENFGVKLDLKAVYRMMDKIDDKQILKLNKLVYNQTKALFKEKIDIVYFDATTLYFESFTEDTGDDAIKKNGYSKDGKFNQPQVVLALMVTKQGLPVGYKAFSGDTFDGHTIVPALKEVQENFNIDKVVFVADSGMFNKTNLKEFDTIHNPFLYKYSNYNWSITTKTLTLKDYQHQLKEFTKSNITYIVGARIKNMSQDITTQILNMDNYKQLDDNTKVATFDYQGKKLLVTHSQKRARKDKHDREKGIEKLRLRLAKNSSVKSQLSNQGYKKYLQLEKTNQDKKDDKKKSSCDISIKLNEQKIEEDSVWDGLKGIVTNNIELSNEELIHQYTNLWQVEESFRITKHDLKIRPIYHWKPSRVKAHLAISFMAYTLVRHLEYRVRLQYIKLSPQKIRKILLSIQATIFYNTKTNKKYAIPSKISQDAKKIYKLMEVPMKTSAYKL